MNNKKDNKKQKNPFLGLIIAAIVALSAISDAGGAAPVLIITLIFIGIGFFVVAAAKKQQRSSDDGMGECEHSAKPTSRSFDGKRLADEAKRFAKESVPEASKMFTAMKMKKDRDDCDDAHEHVEPSYRMTPNEKRASQLKSMLKNGIIDKEEYKILMDRYGL